MTKEKIALELTKEIWAVVSDNWETFYISKQSKDIDAVIPDMTASLVEIYNAVYSGIAEASSNSD